MDWSKGAAVEREITPNFVMCQYICVCMRELMGACLMSIDLSLHVLYAKVCVYISCD